MRKLERTALSVTFDYLPDMRLSVNGRNVLHWAERAKLEKGVREVAWGMAMLRGTESTPIDPAIVKIKFTFKSKRLRDLDNLQSACKPWIDGLVDAHWLIDDCFPHVRKIEAEGFYGGSDMTVISIRPYEK